MGAISLIARRDYFAYVGAWGFWVSLLMAPLIIAGTAATRADAILWSLDRIRERPAYLRLRELRCDADTLKNEF